MPEKVKKILLVEDDIAIVDIYQTMMEKAHFNVDVISLGQDAIKRVREIGAGKEVKPDIIILDLILPDINGIEVLGEIRKNKATKNMKVFILTNQEKAESQAPNGIKPDKFIIKANITPTQLVELIKEQLQ